MIGPAELAAALAAMPPRELCAILDDARRKADEERAAEERERRERERAAIVASFPDLRKSAAALKEAAEHRRWLLQNAVAIRRDPILAKDYAAELDALGY